jgi:hypothetical protein
MVGHGYVGVSDQFGAPGDFQRHTGHPVGDDGGVAAGAKPAMTDASHPKDSLD